MSANTPIILIAGWAHAASEMKDLRDYIARDSSPDALQGGDRNDRSSSSSSTGQVITLATADLWNETRQNKPPSVYAQSLKTMIEKTGLPVFIAGWSLGGIIAIETALNWPELLAGLILISSTPRFCSGLGWPTGTPTGAIRAMLTGLKHNPHSVFKTFFENIVALSKDAEDIIKARIESADAMNLRELIYGLEYLRDSDFSAAVKNLSLPTLIIHGGRDVIINLEAARQLNRLLALSRLRVYDDYGHGLPCQNPRAVAEDIIKFVKECTEKTTA